jgi:serine/threonine-protein kinase HipA
VNLFPERVRELKTWISENTGPAASIDTLLSSMAYFALQKGRAKEILAEVEGAVARWRDVA